MRDTVRHWDTSLRALTGRIAPRFRRAEPRHRALRYVRGLLNPVGRKNGWQLAEHLGERTPDGVQRLLNAADWDAEAVREDLRAYVVERLGDVEAVLVVDETGFVKKGRHSAGVQRQYSGTAGRLENCQIGVFLCYASRHGAAFIDRALYLPKEWAGDEARCRAAGVPAAVRFQTKPQLATTMLLRALSAGVPCRWVTGDELYGRGRRLRWASETRGQPFVLAVGCDEPRWRDGPVYRPAQALTAEWPADAWQRLSAGDGATGPRWYDWAWQPLWRLQLTPQERAWGHWLLVRRSVANPAELAYYGVFAPHAATSLETVVRVAGIRWSIEASFEAAKQECGLDEYEVRRWEAWHRHITLALLAHAFLVAMRTPVKKTAPRRV